MLISENKSSKKPSTSPPLPKAGRSGKGQPGVSNLQRKAARGVGRSSPAKRGAVRCSLAQQRVVAGEVSPLGRTGGLPRVSRQGQSQGSVARDCRQAFFGRLGCQGGSVGLLARVSPQGRAARVGYKVGFPWFWKQGWLARVCCQGGSPDWFVMLIRVKHKSGSAWFVARVRRQRSLSRVDCPGCVARVCRPLCYSSFCFFLLYKMYTPSPLSVFSIRFAF